MNVPTTPGTRVRVRNSNAGIVRRVVAIGALALTVFGLSVSAASAGSDETITTKRGKVQFLNYLDVLSAEDTKRDGYGIEAYLEWNGDLYTSYESFTDDDGAGNGSYGGAIPRLREGTRVWLMMCYVNKAGERVQCSDYQRATA
jgi:hypothetical protein